MEQEKQYKTWDGKNWDGRLFRDEQKKYTVYLPKYGITVKTGLTDAREISYQTEIKALKQSRDMYFALGRLGESRRDFTEGIFKQAAKATGNFVVSSSANLYGWGKDWLWKGYNEHRKGSAERQKFTEMLNKEYQPSYTYEPLKDAQERYNSAIEKVKNSEEYKQFVADNEKKFAESEKSRQEWNLRQRKDLDDFIQKAGLNKNQFDGFTYDLVGGGASAVAALAVGVITKSPAAVAAVFGASAGHEYYTEALAAGLNGNKAMAVGYGAGALEGFLELFGAEGLYRAAVRAKPFKHSINAIIRNARIKLKKQGLKKMGLDMGTAALQGAAVEGSEEFVQDISTAAIMNAAGVRNDEARQVIIDAFYSAALGAITGGALAGGGRGGIQMLAYMQKQSIANKLEQAGFDKENAKEIATEIIDKGYSKQTTDAFIKFAESENSPLTYPNADKEAAAKAFGVQVKELADPAKRAAAAKEIWDIYDKVKADALNAGLPAMWAEFAANSAKNIAAQYSSYLDIMPKEWYEKNKITFINSMKTNWENAGKPQRVSYKDGEKVMTDQTLGGKERFNQPLLNTVDTTQQVNVVDLTNIPVESRKDLENLIQSFINEKAKETTADGVILNFVHKIFRTGKKKDIRVNKHLVLVRPFNKVYGDVHNRAINDIFSLIQNSVLIAKEQNQKQEKANYDEVYRFFVPVKINNGKDKGIYTLQLVALHNKNKNTLKFEADIYEVLIEKSSLGTASRTKRGILQGNTISIEEMMSGVKDFSVIPHTDYILKPVINVNGKQLGTRNSDGRQIAHTPQDIANFWNWFGDSKIVDKDGKPLVVYHGTPNATFDTFKNSEKGIYFATEKRKNSVAGFYAGDKGNIIPVYLSIKNPFIGTPQEVANVKENISEYKAKGYDGIISVADSHLKSQYYNYATNKVETEELNPSDIIEIIAFEPNQIKSVNNTGEFDVNNKDIFYQKQNNQQPVDLTAEFAAEQVKGQDPNLLDLYNVRVKKSSPHTHLSAFAGNTNSITNNGQNDNSFNQDDVIGARGYVEFSTQGAFMHLLENADPSTILHETSGHIQLRNMEQMRDLAETQGATEEFWDIWQGLEKWLGKAQRIENPDGTVKYRFTTEQQEMFAEGMEKMYIAGKAPTTALQKIFEYFKQMLSTMYEEAREWLDLRPEVEQLFEKILAGPQVENADSKLYKGRAKDIKAVAEKARNGESATINGMGIKEVKALLKQLSKRRPALPKDDLYTVLKRKGADYDNAAQIDKEAYENAGIKNKKDGIGDKLALWLKEEGFLSFDEDNGNYRDDSDMEAKAADMIDRALSGEKIYRIEDQEKAEQAENFDANMEAIREAFGNNVEQAEQTLRAIEDLQAKGYRVIGNSDVEYAEEESEKLMSFAEKEKQFKEKIEQLTKDKEELANIAQRRLIEIGRTATSAREEGYKEAIKDAQDEKTVKDLLAIEREAYKNTLDARRVKRALLEELNKREIEGKQEMLKALNEAKSTQEIYKAAQGLMGNLYKAYEESEAGKAQRRKTDIPTTNWNKVKLTAIENFKKIAQQADAEIEQARALDRQASAMRTKGQKPDEKQQAQFDTARNKILKGYGLKFAKALKEAFYGIEHIDNIWLDKEANYLGAQYARGTNILGAELDRFIERAQKRQAKNYKKYIAEKIEKMIEGGYKVKDGQKQKGKFDYLTNKLFEDLKGIGNMDRTFAKKELERRNQIIKNTPSDAEAALQIFGLEGDADNANPALADNMRLENMYLSFKAGKMNKEEMAAQKEYFQAEGLPDTIGDDEWYYVSAQLLGTFYKILNERRKAALEGKILQSMKRAFEEEREREDFANSVKKNGKAGVIKKMYLSVIANWESMLNTLSNAIFKEKFSLLLEEAKAETRVNEKMTEILQTAKKVLRADNAEMKKWIDSLDDKVITVKNRIESKRKALSETDGHLKGKLEMLDQFSKLLGQKNEIVLKDALTLREGQRRGDFNLKVVYDGKEGGLKRIYDRGGLDAVMRSVALLPKGGLDEYSKTAQKYRKDGVILLKNSNDFSAVLKYNEVGGKGTYTLIDFVKYDKDGKQIAGYGLDEVEQNKTVKTLTKTEFENGVRNLSKADKSKVVKIAFAPVSEKLTQLAKRYNLDITGYVHDIENSAITHIDDKHGKVNLEAKRGQIAITEKDLFNIPDIINNPDFIAFGAKDENGKDLITYVKNMPDGSTFFIEEVRTGKKTLSTKSMRKYKGETASGSIAKRISNAHKTNLSNIIVIEKSDFVNVAAERFNQDNNVNSKEIESEIRKAALNAAANVINPFVDTVYAPVEQELTKGEIIDIYNTCKNDIGYARYENQYGYDQLTEMFALLSPREKQIADMWQKTVEGGYDEVNEVFIKQYGLDMGKPENYWPFSVDRIESEIDMLGSNYREASRPGMTKSRTRGTLVEMKPQSPVEKLYRHYNTAMKYVETSEKVSRLRRILRHSIIKKVVKENFGEDALKLLYELLDNSTLGANKNKVKYYHDGIMNWLTNNYVKAAIALKPSITLKQLISVVNYSENMPAGEWAKGFADAISHPKETIDFMMADPYLKARFENGSQNEALMRALAKDFGKNKTVKQLNSWSNMLAINVRLGDIGAIIFGGKPYIDYLMKEKGMSKEDAFKQFRLDTLRSQQASMRSALSRLQAAEMNWLMRALFAFKNTGNQYVRKCADAIISYKRGEMSAKQLAKTLAIYGVINQYLYVALGSLGLFAAAGAGFDDDDKNKQMWAEFMQWPAQNFGFLPIIDDAVNQASYRLVNLALDGKAGPVRNPETPLLKDIYGAVRTLQKDNLSFEDVINAFAPVAQTGTGLPFNYGVNAGKAAGELYKGEFTKTALMLGGYSEKRAQAVAGEE